METDTFRMDSCTYIIGVPGNEKADQEALKATLSLSTPWINTSNAKNEINV